MAGTGAGRKTVSQAPVCSGMGGRWWSADLSREAAGGQNVGLKGELLARVGSGKQQWEREESHCGSRGLVLPRE